MITVLAAPHAVDSDMFINDWGIPDWRNPAAYGDTSRWSRFRWRWEFTRRRDDCRADFLKHAEETLRFEEEVREKMRAKEPERKLPGLLQPHEAGFCASVPDAQKKYGLSTVPNPAIGDQPFYVLIFRERFGGVTLGYGPEWPSNEKAGMVRAPEGTAVVQFDLSRSIVPQWKNIESMLLWYQQKQHGKVIKGRRHPTKWLRYLQVLDGHAGGASWRELQDTAVPHTEKSTPTPQGAKQAYDQAKALMLKWPN